MGRQIYRDIPGPYSTDPQPKLPKAKPKATVEKPAVKPKTANKVPPKG